MKYTGGITIYDEESNTVHDRYLTPDEIIQELLNRPRPDVEEAPAPRRMADRIVTKTGRQGKRAKKSPQPKAPREPGQVGCDECGSRGHKHKNGCSRSTRTPKAAHPQEKKPGGKMPFSEATYDSVRALMDKGVPTDTIIAEKGLDPEHVRAIQLSSTYDDYRRKI